VQDLVDTIATTRDPGGRFHAVAPDWFGDRVFGGMVVAQALHAAMQTVDDDRRPHSMHADFLGALRPGPNELEVESLRDGRTFATRQVTSIQNGRRALRATVSFHGADHGDEYQLPMPDAPAPETLPREEDPGPGPPFDMRDVGPTERRADGTYRSTRRYWARALAPLPETPIAHYTVAAFMSDMTGTSFRPYSLGEWGTHTDASIDHALWFHREPRFDEWVYVDFHALVNHAGRSTVRGEFYDREGRLSMSIAQELLIRPLDAPDS
jgi:acyl-CoA thioesterase-2